LIIDVTAEMKDINFVPASEYEEILQNVRTIINTLKKTVPMDREFGINGEIIDLPIAAAQAKITGEIVAAVSKYEPRAKVVSVSYEGKETDGQLLPTVRIRIQ
jgi:phage baseplate assembly protein W